MENKSNLVLPGSHEFRKVLHQISSEKEITDADLSVTGKVLREIAEPAWYKRFWSWLTKLFGTGPKAVVHALDPMWQPIPTDMNDPTRLAERALQQREMGIAESVIYTASGQRFHKDYDKPLAEDVKDNKKIILSL